MTVEGIFFDEILGLYDWQKFSYLKIAQEEVKRAARLGQELIGVFNIAR